MSYPRQKVHECDCGDQHQRVFSLQVLGKAIKAAKETVTIPNCPYGSWEDGKQVICDQPGWKNDIDTSTSTGPTWCARQRWSTTKGFRWAC